MQPKESPHGQENPKQKEQSGRHHATDFKLYYKAIVIKTACTGTKTEIQTNGTEQRPQKKHHTSATT